MRPTRRPQYVLSVLSEKPQRTQGLASVQTVQLVHTLVPRALLTVSIAMWVSMRTVQVIKSVLTASLVRANLILDVLLALIVKLVVMRMCKVNKTVQHALQVITSLTLVFPIASPAQWVRRKLLSDQWIVRTVVQVVPTLPTDNLLVPTVSLASIPMYLGWSSVPIAR